MNRIEYIFIRLCRTGIGISFAVLIITVMTQVISRTLGTSPVWTEELTRFALLYMTAFGAGLSIRSGELVNVDILSESLGGIGARILQCLSCGTIVLLCAVLVGPAWRYVSIGAFQTSPALGVRMDYVHGSILLLLLVLLVSAVFKGIDIWSETDEPTTTEENSN